MNSVCVSVSGLMRWQGLKSRTGKKGKTGRTGKITEMDERFICLVSLAARDLSGMIARLGHAAEKIKKKNWRKTYGMGKCETCKEGKNHDKGRIY